MNRRMIVLACAVLMLLLCSQAAFASTLCQVGDTGETVHIVQTRLYTLGYQDEAPVSPYKFTASTKAHVRKFQLASGFETTGIVDEKTYETLTSSSAVSYEQHLNNIHTPGKSGVEVTETEARLKKLGYFPGKPNVRYDENTAKAVTIFQRAHYLKETGNADARTRSLLFSDNAITAQAYKEKNNLTDLKKGSRGDQVVMLQNQLKRLGYYSADVSGSFDAATELAVKMFQAANDLKVTGIADEDARFILNAGTGKTYSQYASEQAAVEVKLGDSGLSVTLLQQQLTDLAFYSGAINGKFTAAVQTSVKHFQNANHVNTTGTKHGVATRATRAAMNSPEVINRYDSEGLMSGDEIPAVSEMTQALKDLGYLSGTSAKFTTTVQKAVKLFQKANKIKETGIATPATLKVLYSGTAISYDEFKNGSGNAKIEKVIDFAMKYLGKPYKSPCNAPSNFDCSGFVRFCMAKAAGISLSGEVTTQGNQCKKRYTVINDMTSLKRGDLLYFDTQESKPIGHAAIYLGKSNGKPKFIHASSAAGKVVVSEFSDWYQQRFLFGARWTK